MTKEKDKALKEICNQIKAATTPEELFGNLGNQGRDKKLRQLELRFQELNKALIVDTSTLDSQLTQKVMSAKVALEELYDWAKSSVVNGSYGDQESSKEDSSGDATNEIDSTDQETTITTKNREYYITEVFCDGDLSTIYRGYYLEGTTPVNIVVKIMSDPDDKDFAKREAKALEHLYTEPNNEGKQLKHLPQLMDQFITEGGQRANILSYLDGYNLESFKERLKKPKNRQYQSRHLTWLLSRSLSVLGYAHSKGVIHKNISPTNLVIRPRDHNLWLIDWTYSTVDPIQSGVKFFVADEDFSAPEVEERPELPPGSQVGSTQEAMYLNAIKSADLYSLGKCMIYVVGGNLKTNKMPQDIEEPLQRLILSFLLPSPLQRQRDAWEAHRELRKIAAQLWGSDRKFIEFVE